MDCYDPSTHVYYPRHDWDVGSRSDMRHRCVRCHELDLRDRPAAAIRAAELAALGGPPADLWLEAWDSLPAAARKSESRVTARAVELGQERAAAYAARRARQFGEWESRVADLAVPGRQLTAKLFGRPAVATGNRQGDSVEVTISLADGRELTRFEPATWLEPR